MTDPLPARSNRSSSRINPKNLTLGAFILLTIIFALVAVVEADRAASTTTITSTGVVSINGGQQFVICEATTYSVAGTVTSGQTSNPTTTLGSTTYVTATNETETSGYVTTSTQALGPPTAPPYEIVTCTYVS